MNPTELLFRAKSLPIDDIFNFQLPEAPLKVDPWVASSLLQKAIRRSDLTLAGRAASTLFNQRGAGIWRRLMIIAFEDVGAGSLDTIVQTTLIASDTVWRKKVGHDVRLAVYLARLLAAAPKDRCADYLICAAKDHPELEAARELAGCALVEERLKIVADASKPLPVRATAAWYVSGIEWGNEKRVGKGDLPGLLATLRSLGVPSALVEATRIAATKTREPITIMVPLLWQAAFGEVPPTVVEVSPPPSPVVDGIPLYAFDKHTRIGKRAIHLFARSNDAVRSCLEDYVPEYRAQEAACVAAFYADAAPVRRALAWKQSSHLERLGTGNDLLRSGVAPGGIRPLLEAVRSNLDHLNEIRASLFQASQG